MSTTCHEFLMNFVKPLIKNSQNILKNFKYVTIFINHNEEHYGDRKSFVLLKLGTFTTL